MLTETRLNAVQEELGRLRRENRRLHEENDRLYVENDRLHAALQREAKNAHLSLYGTHEMTAGTCVGPRRRRR